MKINNARDIKKSLFIFLLTNCTLINAQIGINTTNPQTVFHIDGSGDNPPITAPSTSQKNNDIFIWPTGQLSLGSDTPRTKVDTRNSGNQGFIAVGSTNQTASDAGDGAIQYTPEAGGKILFSKDNSWFEISSSPKKIYIRATTAFTGNINNNATTNIATWNLSSDFQAYYTNAGVYANPGFFNATTGVFTAPKAGSYSVNIFVAFSSTTLSLGSATAVFRHVNPISGEQLHQCLRETGGSSSGSLFGISCNVQITMEKGDTLRPAITNNTGSVKNLLNDSSANIMSIVEL
ncbi:hypothetical protein [Chryseobacterium foetidum]|uniref:hypothetical protein n=1 Tax=Chryseobacterium foetidum TaxID=2951057 RepID=UPI0021C7E88B|nr:hypothetical protein [Chryseobacterium foetidum]